MAQAQLPVTLFQERKLQQMLSFASAKMILTWPWKSLSPYELPALPLDRKRRVGLHYETYSQTLGPNHTLGTQMQKLIVLTQSVFAFL